MHRTGVYLTAALGACRQTSAIARACHHRRQALTSPTADTTPISLLRPRPHSYAHSHPQPTSTPTFIRPLLRPHAHSPTPSRAHAPTPPPAPAPAWQRCATRASPAARRNCEPPGRAGRCCGWRSPPPSPGTGPAAGRDCPPRPGGQAEGAGRRKWRAGRRRRGQKEGWAGRRRRGQEAGWAGGQEGVGWDGMEGVRAGRGNVRRMGWCHVTACVSRHAGCGLWVGTGARGWLG